MRILISCQTTKALAQRLEKCFMLNSAEHEFFLIIKVKMPSILGILTFMSRQNSILRLSEPEQKLKFLVFLYLYTHLKFHALLSEHEFFL